MAVAQSKRGWDGLLDGEHRRKLEAELPGFLKRQRWFAGKAREISSARILDANLPGDVAEAYRLTLLEVAYEGGRVESYFLPLGLASGPAADRIVADAPARAVARLEPFGLVYDALADPALAEALLAAIESTRSIHAAAGTIRAFPTSAFAAARGPVDRTLPVAGGSFEQSNSAVIFGDRLILKVFRRLEPGINPDFEIGRFFAEKTDFAPIPKTAGAIIYDRGDDAPLMLGILQGLVRNEGSGWDHALAELKAYYGRVEAQGGRGPGDDGDGRSFLELSAGDVPAGAARAIGPYLEAAATLGRRTAEMHLALASDPDDAAFRPEPLTTDDLGHLALAIRGQVELALRALASKADGLPAPAAGQARRIIDGQGRLLGSLNDLAALRVQATKTRCHGDYHLGQVLRTEGDFVILDFEGEPAKSLPERLAKVSPLKDVVGMIRSFDYAAYAALFAHAADRPEVFDALSGAARAWRTWTSATFLKHYLDTAAGASFLPRDPAQLGAILDALTLDKALYELLYELNNRPDWVRIPLQGVSGLLDSAESTSRAAASEAESAQAEQAPSRFGEMDRYLLGEGTHYRAFDLLGAHPAEQGGEAGVAFAVWAPNARAVHVIGDFNAWSPSAHPMTSRDDSGYWERFVPGVPVGATYKYADHFPRGRLPGRQGRPLRLRRRAPAPDRLDRRRPRIVHLGRRRLPGPPQGDELARGADLDLRGPPGVVDAGRRRVSGYPTPRSARSWPTTCTTWGSPTSN